MTPGENYFLWGDFTFLSALLENDFPVQRESFRVDPGGGHRGAEEDGLGAISEAGGGRSARPAAPRREAGWASLGVSSHADHFVPDTL